MIPQVISRSEIASFFGSWRDEEYAAGELLFHHGKGSCCRDQLSRADRAVIWTATDLVARRGRVPLQRDSDGPSRSHIRFEDVDLNQLLSRQHSGYLNSDMAKTRNTRRVFAIGWIEEGELPCAEEPFRIFRERRTLSLWDVKK